MSIKSVSGLVEKANVENKKISQVVIEIEGIEMDVSREHLIEKMELNFDTMKNAIKRGIASKNKSESGLSGGDANLLYNSVKDNKIPQSIFTNAMVYALATAEQNACMGKIVAAPTAGACGILPAVLFSAMKEYNFTKEQVVSALFTAGGIGTVIAKRASISGAQGGCQAECGSAAAMAGAALTELMGGTPVMASHACALALKSCMGLICDPVAGLVEVPCVKRNATLSVSAISAAFMALSGIESVIPADEVIDSMKSVGDKMSCEFKETSHGGIAISQTAKAISKKLFDECK